MESATRTQRSDARRNREVVIDSAIALLNRNPNASMAEIASASRVGRTTVYRHFPNREDLLVALFARVVEESQSFTAVVAAEATSAEDLLRRLAPPMIELGLRFRFLHSYRHLGKPTLDESKKMPEEPVRTYLEAAQKRGEVRTDYPPSWIATMIQSVTIAALDDIEAGILDRETAERVLAETLVAALIPR